MVSNSPPLEGWIQPTGEDGVVKKHNKNKSTNLTI